MSNWGMYTPYGNSRVEQLLMKLLKEGATEDQIRDALLNLAKTDPKCREAYDTAVRDACFDFCERKCTMDTWYKIKE